MEEHEIDCFKAELSQKDFKVFSDYIYKTFGIKMPDVKRVMLQGRLLKRIRELKMKSYTEYKDYFFSEEGQKKELYNFLSVVTTNKTDFFREVAHFDFMQSTALPGFIAEGRNKIRLWSAACSSGEEPYTMSIVLNEFKEKEPQLAFEILATDISTNVMDKMKKGIYAEKLVEVIPLALKRKYFLRSKDRTNPTVMVSPLLRQNISLLYLNFMDDVYDVQGKFDIILCRNVLIYFDRPTQEKVVRKLVNFLTPGGYLMIGHSESIASITDLPLENVKPTIFRRI